jgi:ribosomal protein L12E/L44/L45/RPP1/RPP2
MGVVEETMEWDWRKIFGATGAPSRVWRGVEAAGVMDGLWDDTPKAWGERDLVVMQVVMKRGGVPAAGGLLIAAGKNSGALGKGRADTEDSEESSEEGEGGGFILDTGDMDAETTVQGEKPVDDDDTEGEMQGEEAEEEADEEGDGSLGVGLVLGGYYSTLHGKGIGIALCSPAKLLALCPGGGEEVTVAVANTQTHRPQPATLRAWRAAP